MAHTNSYVKTDPEGLVVAKPGLGESVRDRVRIQRAATSWRDVLISMLLATAVVAGCGRKHAPRGEAKSRALPSSGALAADASPAALRGKPKSMRELPTTSGAIYIENLEGQIAELDRLTREAPELVANVKRLSALRHTRGRIFGDPDEIKRGIDTLGDAVRRDPDDARVYLTRAEQEQSLHRFADARADLERARRRPGVDVTRASDLETELDWNDGLYDKAIAAIRKARRDRPSSHTWLREAQLDHDLGLDDASDRAFEAAEDAISDTSPLEVAHLFLQRGIQLASRGRLDDACVFFREAAARLPAYVAATEHLAEALHGLGRDEEAAALYEKIVHDSNDPEFLHALAEIRKAQGKRDEARELDARARHRYEQLLEKYPEAMYWHASELYLATGDAKKALTLLRANVTLRPNGASYVALARAELANGHGAEAKKAIDRALAMPLRSAALFWTASRVYRSAGDAAAADRYRERAKAANPRIEEGESP